MNYAASAQRLTLHEVRDDISRSLLDGCDSRRPAPGDLRLRVDRRGQRVHEIIVINGCAQGRAVEIKRAQMGRAEFTGRVHPDIVDRRHRQFIGQQGPQDVERAT